MLSMLDTLKTNVPGSCDCYCPPNMRRLQCKAIFHLLLIFKANLLIFNFCICVTDVILSVCFRIHKEENRIPQEIAIAECLCQGCIINQREERMYNSVPVFGKLRILMKTTCPTDPQRYMIEESTVKIPVACTCVVPRTIVS